MSFGPQSIEEFIPRVKAERLAGKAWEHIRRELGMGASRFGRLRAAVEQDLPADAKPPAQPQPENHVSVQRRKRREQKPAMKEHTITITFTERAYERLEWIADSAFMTPDAFCTALLAAYISDAPQTITLAPANPDEAEEEETEEDESGAGEDEEQEEEEEAGEDAGDEEPPPEKEFEFHESDFDWVKPGAEFVVEYKDKQISVKCESIWRMDPKTGSKRTIPAVTEAGDIIRCQATNGEFDGELEFYPEEIIFED